MRRTAHPSATDAGWSDILKEQLPSGLRLLVRPSHVGDRIVVCDIVDGNDHVSAVVTLPVGPHLAGYIGTAREDPWTLGDKLTKVVLRGDLSYSKQ